MPFGGPGLLIEFHFYRFLSLAGILVFRLIMIVGGLPCLADVGNQQASQKDFQALFDPSGRSQNTTSDLEALPVESRQTECGYQTSNEDAENLESRDAAKVNVPGPGLSQYQCLGNPVNIIKRWKDASVTVIDVRSRENYERSHLPGSLNIPSYSIKTKAFLKSKSLVLIDDGVSVASLLAVCDSLKISGFNNVTVFGDGVHVWRKLTANNTDFKLKQDMRKLTPKQFVSVKNEYQWLIVSLDENMDDIKKDFERSRVISYSSRGAVFARKLDQTFASGSPAGDRRLLFVSRDGAGSAEIDSGALKAYSNSMYYLAGGLKAYREYVKTRSALLVRANAKPRQEKGCGI
ncbi:MAG TPA: rhodanese-like domain-containing protein [Gammaproteobacteria bacterium]|nr:rhodanese-like domain-containing protein [Gammaproteobacteria bacterium]